MKRLLIHLGVILAVAGMGHFIAYKMFNIPGRLELVVAIIALLFYPVIRKPILGVYAFFIISPFIPYFRRLYYLIYSRPEIDPLIIIGDGIIAITIIGLFFEWKDRLNENPKVRPFVIAISIYFFYLLIRTFVFNSMNASVAISVFKLYGPPVLLFFIGIIYAGDRKHLKRVWHITIAIGVVAAVYGIKQLYVGYSEAERIWFSSIEFTTLFIKGVARPFSFFQAPVVFADYMQLAIIGVLMIIELKKNKTGYLLFILIPILFYGILITSVRTSWAGVMLTLLLWYGFFRVKESRKRIAFFLLIAISYLGYELISDLVGAELGMDAFFNILAQSSPKPEYVDLLVTKRTSALTNPLQEHSFLSRMVLWKAILSYSDNPINALMGRGIGTLKADSLYFTYLAELGYPGLIFIVGIFIAFIGKGFYAIDNSKDGFRVTMARGITIMNIIFAIVSITGTHIHYFPGDAYFWFWNGYLVKISADIKRDGIERAAT